MAHPRGSARPARASIAAWPFLRLDLGADTTLCQPTGDLDQREKPPPADLDRLQALCPEPMGHAVLESASLFGLPSNDGNRLEWLQKRRMSSVQQLLENRRLNAFIEFHLAHHKMLGGQLSIPIFFGPQQRLNMCITVSTFNIVIQKMPPSQ
jgi:hypothetical protein